MRTVPAIVDDHGGGEDDQVDDHEQRDDPRVLAPPRYRPEERELHSLLFHKILSVNGQPQRGQRLQQQRRRRRRQWRLLDVYFGIVFCSLLLRRRHCLLRFLETRGRSESLHSEKVSSNGGREILRFWSLSPDGWVWREIL